MFKRWKVKGDASQHELHNLQKNISLNYCAAKRILDSSIFALSWGPFIVLYSQFHPLKLNAQVRNNAAGVCNYLDGDMNVSSLWCLGV